jgi:membrane-associated phospholipid phosphatase
MTLASPLVDRAHAAAPSTAGHADEGGSLVTRAAVFLVAAGLFGLIARGVATRRIQRADDRTRHWMQARRLASLDAVVRPVTLLSLPALVVSATMMLAWWLRREKRVAAALAVAVTPLIAATAGQSFTMLLPQRNPPGSAGGTDGTVTTPSFPSGHTTGVMAEALTIAYVLSREEMVTGPALGALAAWPLLVGAARVYRDRHWASDIIGGLAAGTAVAAATTMLYDAQRQNGAHLWWTIHASHAPTSTN